MHSLQQKGYEFMEKRQIVNIVNFIRGVEPRANIDLLKPVTEQAALMQKHGLRGTFLFQYDALLMPEFTDFVKSLPAEQFELGVWHEIVQPETEACGLKWTGRYPWDWHAHCGFSVGYTKSEREKLADELFEKFREVFGYYPRVFGSWFFDSHTVRYLYDKYGLDAVCNCKEQYGTDGYTLWGGYYGQAYYPSRTNVFMPAQTEEAQLDVPLFRMLGSDPIYQYDFGMNISSGAPSVQGVITLEPVYNGGGGGVPKWVDWFMRENYNGDCLTFGYAQAGQENSFGWDSMKNGLTYQFALFEKLQNEGKIVAEPIGETGRWYKETYKTTPASAITAHTAYDDENKNSIWYSSKFYRINLYAENGSFRIRDLHIFKESYVDPFENCVCTGNEAIYDTLPVVDGNRYSGNGILAGAFLKYSDGKSPVCGKMVFTDTGNGTACVQYGSVKVELDEAGFVITADESFVLENHIGRDGGHLWTAESVSENELRLKYNGEEYSVKLDCGHFRDEKTMVSSGNALSVRVNQ